MISPESEINLKKIDPSILVGDKQDDLEDFFLTLAVIYNDLKGLAHLQKDFLDNHVAPEDSGKPTGYAGEFHGMTTQFYKTLAGFINEFLIFLKEHENIYQHPKFQILILRLPKARKLEWEEILRAVHGKTDNNPNSLAHKLMLIRNNIAFHYYQSQKILRKSFRDFFDDKTRPGADYAYYALGKSLEGTRFYYADAAVQRYLMDAASKNGELSFEEKVEAYRKLQDASFDLLGNMNTVIASLLKEFIHLRQEGLSRA